MTTSDASLQNGGAIQASLTTTCTYDNPDGGPVGFGEDTEDEMCFNFVLTYPIDIVPADYRVCMTG